jgi:C4-dicarboxylate-specific signal transduction histidine kinase
LTVEGGGHLADVLGDAGETQQIVLNLLLNAADAVKTNSDPCIEIVLEDLEWKEEDGQANAFVACSVYDNGPGVGAEDRERIFDPFFTTKPVGEGTGLGLANALNLAELQGGKLEYLPAGKPGKGCFRLALPTWSGPTHS